MTPSFPSCLIAPGPEPNKGTASLATRLQAALCRTMTTLTVLTKAAERLVPESDGKLRKRLELAWDAARAVDGVPGLSMVK